MALGGVTRGISIALSLATQGFNAGLNSASGALRNFANTSRQDLAAVGTYAGIAGAAVAAGMGVAVGASMKFESQMSNVRAMTEATGGAYDALRSQALDLGASTVFTATEVAGAQAELAKAGLSTAAILGGAVEGAVSLAAAAQIDLGQAAEYTAVALNQFNLPARDASYVADVLAAAANKSAADVDGLMLALRQVGTAADMAGMGFTETVSAVSIFADAGMKGSDAGTSLKTMLLRLNPSTEKASEAMRELGLTFEDGEGGFVDLDTAAERLRITMEGLTETERTQYLTRIFGQDAIRASALLYEAGGEGVRKMTDAIDEQGYAAEVAAIKMDNLGGDVEKLGGAIDTVLINAGSEANGVLREMVQTATSVVQQFGEMPGWFNTIGMGVGGLTVAVTGSVAALGTFIPMARNVKEALTALGGGWATVASAMNMRNFMAITAGLAGIGIAYTLVASQIQGAKQAAEEANAAFVAKLDTPTDYQSSLDYANALIAEHTRLTGVLAESSDAAGGFWDDYERGSEKFYEWVNVFGEDTYMKTEERLKGLEELMGPVGASTSAYQANLYALAIQLGMTTTEVERFAAAQGIDLIGASEAVMVGLEEQGVGWDIIDGKFQLLPKGQQAVREGFDGISGAMTAAKVEANLMPANLSAIDSAMNALSDETLSATDRMDAFERAVAGVLGLALDPQRFRDEVTQAVWDTRDAAEELGAAWSNALTAMTPEAIAFRGQMDGFIRTIGEQVVNIRATTNSQDEMNAAINTGVKSLEDMRNAGLISTETMNHYAEIVRGIPHEADTQITTPGMSEAQTSANALDATLDELERQRQVQVNIENARNQINQLIGQYTNFTVNGYVKVWGGIPSANGNIFMPTHAFGRGGFEWHHGHIAAAGAGRFYAEPETGGESYIPLAPSKRGRSTEILRQTNAMMGNPLGASGGGTVTTIGDVNVTVHAPNYVGSHDELARAVEVTITRDGRVQDAVLRAARSASSARDGMRGG